MVEDRDSEERLTDVVDVVGAPGDDDDPLGMRVGPGTEERAALLVEARRA